MEGCPKYLVHARSECTCCIITRFRNCDRFQIGAKAHPLRARARITSHFGVLRHPSGKARGLRILVCKGRATPPDGMDLRPKMGSYSCASPNVEGSFISSLLSDSCSSSHCFTIIFQGAPPSCGDPLRNAVPTQPCPPHTDATKTTPCPRSHSISTYREEHNGTVQIFE